MSRKQEFTIEFDEKIANMKYIVLAVRLPDGAIELITNTMNFVEKFEYINSMYDKDLIMNTNPDIVIVNWMIV